MKGGGEALHSTRGAVAGGRKGGGQRESGVSFWAVEVWVFVGRAQWGASKKRGEEGTTGVLACNVQWNKPLCYFCM